MNFSPVVLFTYNRPDHTEKTLKALAQNKLIGESPLYIFIDGPKNDSDKENNDKVIKLCEKFDKGHQIFIEKSTNNQGLSNSVIQGISYVLSEHDRVIVLEDDIVTSPYFISYMNDALNFYETDAEIFSVAGYSLPIKMPESYREHVYLSRRGTSWGWGTWKDRWNKTFWERDNFSEFLGDREIQRKFNRGGEDLTPMLKKYLKGFNDSWAIRFAYCQFVNNGFTLTPVNSFVKNIGMDGSGVHYKRPSTKLETDFGQSIYPIEFKKNLETDEEIEQEVRNLLRPSAYRKLLNFIQLELNLHG